MRESVAKPVHFQWALMLDCEKQGCDPKHGDDGEIFDVAETIPDQPWTVNNHATTVVVREIGRWLPEMSLAHVIDGQGEG